MAADRLVTPKFLTVDPASRRPRFGGGARGDRPRRVHPLAERVKDTESALRAFDDISYRYDEALSEPGEPAFVCQEFGGKGPLRPPDLSHAWRGWNPA